jgi:putative ATPase
MGDEPKITKSSNVVSKPNIRESESFQSLKDDVYGVGKGAVIRKMIDSGNVMSFILWGPPGVGKTTLARIIANQLKRPFFSLSAVNSGVKDVRDTIEKRRNNSFLTNQILFYLLMRFIVSTKVSRMHPALC